MKKEAKSRSKERRTREQRGETKEARKAGYTSSSPEPNSSDLIFSNLERAREISWREHGKRITFYLPGMFKYNGLRGSYPCISITGGDCALQCDHCRGSLLTSMIPALTPEHLIARCLHMAEKGSIGVLLSGGCDAEGRLPWAPLIPAIAEVKKRTRLHISIHSGLVDQETAIRLRGAGVDQALIDVVGDDETYRTVCHVPFGVSRIVATLEAFNRASLPVIPHIVCGLYHGEIKGEKDAIEMISNCDVEQVVVVALMKGGGAPGFAGRVGAEDVAEVIAGLRFRIPGGLVSLGCARERGNTRMEILALEAGVNRMALPSEETVSRALEYGLDVRYQRTCCSVAMDLSTDEW